MKNNRQKKIIEIISSRDVETQDELIECLRQEGFHVTQATVSRDIRELDIIKISTDSGRYKYTASFVPESNVKLSGTFGGSLSGGVISSINCAGNIIVIKTSPGMSGAVAVAVDSMSDPEILGCVAGDDTIIAVVSDENYAKDIVVKMKSALSMN